MKDKLIIVTNWNMVDGSWCWIDLNDRDCSWKIHCPYDSKEKAIERAKEVMEYTEQSYELIIQSEVEEQ